MQSNYNASFFNGNNTLFKYLALYFTENFIYLCYVSL